MNPRRLASRGGFTLVELLIAGTIGSMLVGALFVLLFGSLRLRETANRATAAQPPREHALAVLRADLENAAAPNGVLAGAFLGQSGAALRSGQLTLAFFTTTGTVAENQPWGELQQVEYALAEPLDEAAPAGGFDLTRTVRRNLLATAEEEEDAEDDPARVLLSGVAALTLEFWDGMAWQAEWDSTANENRNPAAVRVRIDFVPVEGESPVPPLELIAAPGAQPRASAAAAVAAVPTPAVPPAPSTPPAGGGGGGP